MAIYTIGDLHLSFHESKPMDIFGENWKEHERKIKNDWIEKVTDKDLVIIPGDFSWATYLKDTYEDFRYINSLPGKKLLLKGNHDYWWTTLKSMREFTKENGFENIDFLYNTAYEFENCIIAGTRGWSQSQEEINEKMIQRETQRLELSLKQANEILMQNCQEKENNERKEIIVFMHYPPITKNQIEECINANKEVCKINEFVRVMKENNIKRCYYGHLHGSSIKEAVEGKYDGIEFKLVSADGLDFKLLKIRD